MVKGFISCFVKVAAKKETAVSWYRVLFLGLFHDLVWGKKRHIKILSTRNGPGFSLLGHPFSQVAPIKKK